MNIEHNSPRNKKQLITTCRYKYYKNDIHDGQVNEKKTIVDLFQVCYWHVLYKL